MANLTQIELQNLRHLIGVQDTNFQKLNSDKCRGGEPG